MNFLAVGDQELKFTFGKQPNNTKYCTYIPSIPSFYSLRLGSMQENNPHCSQMKGEVVSQSLPIFVIVNQANSKPWLRGFPAFPLILVGISISEDVCWVK